jgi:hypothetical protein
MTLQELAYALKKTNGLLHRINELEDALAALLADDNEKTRADALRALECS